MFPQLDFSNTNFLLSSTESVPLNKPGITSNDYTDFKNYAEDMEYYRGMIKKMNSDIGTLSNKLLDIEKSNSVSLSFSLLDSNHKIKKDNQTDNPKFQNAQPSQTPTPNILQYNHSQLNNANCNQITPDSQRTFHDSSHVSNLSSTGNFKFTQFDLLEKSIVQMREQLNQNLLQKDERLIKLEQDREFLMEKNNELEKEINRLDSLINININNPMNNTGGNTNIGNVQTVQRVSPKTKRLNSNMSANKDIDTYVRKDSNGGGGMGAQDKRASSGESVNRNSKGKKKKRLTAGQSTTPFPKKKKSVTRISPDKNIQAQNEAHSRLIEQENAKLKARIIELEKKIESLVIEVTPNEKSNEIVKAKDNSRVELEIWKTRCESISRKYLDEISSLKKQLFQEKAYFINQIKSIQDGLITQVKGLKSSYQSTIEKQEIKIGKLIKENDELKKKFQKVKEIFTICGKQ